MNCTKCNEEIENDFTGLCKKCFSDEWDESIEKSPMVSPEMIEDFRVGDIVNYHSIIGGPVTSENHKIKEITTIGKTTMVFISNHRGGVAVESISKMSEKIKLNVMADKPKGLLDESAEEAVRYIEGRVPKLTKRELEILQERAGEDKEKIQEYVKCCELLEKSHISKNYIKIILKKLYNEWGDESIEADTIAKVYLELTGEVLKGSKGHKAGR